MVTPACVQIINQLMVAVCVWGGPGNILLASDVANNRPCPCPFWWNPCRVSLNGLGIYRSSVKLCMMQTDSYKVSTCVIHVCVNVGEYLCVCKASSLVSLCGQQLHNIIMVLIKTNVQLRGSLQPGNLVHSLLKYTVLCSHTS